jgi:hypothetical protein
MKYKVIAIVLFILISVSLSGIVPNKPIRVLVITGGHDYNIEEFNKMFDGLDKNIKYVVAELPAAFDTFLPENRSKYDVLVFYHMWQTITTEQETLIADCIRGGKPLVVLHHSICAFDDWPEYTNIVGGKYFHKQTTLNGIDYPESSYIHDLHFKVKIADPKNPVTKGLADFEIFDETYKGYYVQKDVTPILTTDEPTSTPIIAWTKTYGKARVVTIQSGHDVPTFKNPNYQKLLRQAINWVYEVR